MSVEVRQLRKDYGDFTAVKDLSFSVAAGTLFAFLGANGAGKSTTIGCITTTLRPTKGEIFVAGHNVITDADQARTQIGAVFQSSLLDPLLTVKENLAIRAGFYGMNRSQAADRITELADLVNLKSFLSRRYGVLSGGQKRRADIARALLHNPAVLFLDEPTAGLDPQSREQIWSAIGQLRQDLGTTVFLTTHYMEETERAQRVCIIERGEIVAEGTPAELRAQHSSSVLTVRTDHPTQVLTELTSGGLTATQSGNEIRIAVDSALTARDLLTVLPITDFEFRHGTMDDVFLAVTGGETA